MEEERKWRVYCHTNKINNKAYIGITCKNVNDRWGKNGSHYKNNKHFWNAIQKYGWDNFEHVVLFENFTKEKACQTEILLIALFNTQDPNLGYNVSPGGNLGMLGCHLSEETKKKLSDANKGKCSGNKNPMYGVSPKERMDESTYEIWRNKLIDFTTSDEFKQQCRERNVGKKYSDEINKKKGKKGSEHPMYGKHHSEETKEKLSKTHQGRKIHTEDSKRKISEAMRGEKNPFYGKIHSEETRKKMSKNRKKTAIVCVETGEFFESVISAASFIGQKSTSNLHSCLRNKNKTCGGYHWVKYEEVVSNECNFF